MTSSSRSTHSPIVPTGQRQRGPSRQIDARVHRLERKLHRAKNLIVGGAIDQEEYDQVRGLIPGSGGQLEVARANRRPRRG